MYLLEKYNKIFYNMDIKIPINNILWVNNIDEEVYNDFLEMENNFYSIEGDKSKYKKNLVFLTDDNIMYHFNGCYVNVLEYDRVCIKYKKKNIIKIDKRNPIYKEMKTLIRKMKIDSLLK